MNRRWSPTSDTGMLREVKIGKHDVPGVMQQNI
jgi:hypothetical protein